MISQLPDHATFGNSNKASVEVSVGSTGWLDFDRETVISLVVHGRPPGPHTLKVDDDRLAIKANRREAVLAHRSPDSAPRANHHCLPNGNAA
jgi:hypothetical protein